MIETNLCRLMDKHGSDKGSRTHQYTRVYNELFKDLVGSNINLFELGIGTNYLDTPSSMGESGIPGASLRAWREYFPFANIYAGDIDSRILFEEDRIKTFHVDQTNRESIRTLWNNELLQNLKFDIIIEDGLHEVDANVTFLQESFNKLKYGGLYIIEDMIISNIPDFINKITGFMRESEVSYFDMKMINSTATNSLWDNYWNWDNCLVVFRK